MERKDEFTDWLKEKILSNPEEPAANGWDQIVESLDLEETWEEIGQDLELEEIWQKVDTRLHRYGFLQLFERIGYGISGMAAMAMLFGLWWGGGLSTENSLMPIASAPDTLVEAPVHTKQDQRTSSSTTTDPQRESQEARAESALAEERTLPHSPEPEKGKRREAFKSPAEATPAQRREVGKTPVETPDKQVQVQEQQPSYFTALEDETAESEPGFVNRRPFINFPAILPEWGEILAVDSLQEVAMPGERNNTLSHSLFPAMEAGVGSAAKLSWLVNDKTIHALEKTSLVTAVPAVYTDVFLTYGLRIHPNFMLQADGYLLDWSGQRYHEYRNGAYGEVEDKLLYRSLGLSLKKAGRQLTYSSMPMFSQLNAGLYGGLLKGAQEHSVEGPTDTRNRYGKFHFGLQAGYGYELYLLDNLLLNYGVRGRLDLLNIYSGTAAVPASLRKTRNASLDFVISLKYVLKK